MITKQCNIKSVSSVLWKNDLVGCLSRAMSSMHISLMRQDWPHWSLLTFTFVYRSIKHWGSAFCSNIISIKKRLLDYEVMWSNCSVTGTFPTLPSERNGTRPFVLRIFSDVVCEDGSRLVPFQARLWTIMCAVLWGVVLPPRGGAGPGECVLVCVHVCVCVCVCISLCVSVSVSVCTNAASPPHTLEWRNWPAYAIRSSEGVGCAVLQL